MPEKGYQYQMHPYNVLISQIGERSAGDELPILDIPVQCLDLTIGGRSAGDRLSIFQQRISTPLRPSRPLGMHRHFSCERNQLLKRHFDLQPPAGFSGS